MNKIKERREQLGLSQTRVACSAGLAQGTLSSMETGKLQPWPRARWALAKALGCREEDLFPKLVKAKGVD